MYQATSAVVVTPGVMTRFENASSQREEQYVETY